MDHKLAEQLREAGFPQSREGRRIGAPTAFVWRARDLVYVPSLEELITSCGDAFERMTRLPDGRFEVAGPAIRKGESPSEAAARLWLALGCADRSGSGNQRLR